MKRNLFFFGLISAVLVMFLSGCDNLINNEDPTISAVTVSPATATVTKGGTQTFTATVVGTGSPAQTVNWSIVEQVVQGTAITTGGVLIVATGETAPSFTIQATSTVDTGKSGTAVVTVSSTAATVGAVTVSPATVTVAKGETQTFTATVAGTGAPAQTVTWSVEGAAATGTAITGDGGVLTVAAGETATSLTVRATSTVDTGKSGTAAVTVSAGSGKDNPKTVTVTGLSAYNGSIIWVALLETKPTGYPDLKEADFGSDMVTIEKGSATMSLYDFDDDSPWTGTGNWYVGFVIKTPITSPLDQNTINRTYVAKTTKSFSGNNVTVALTDCDAIDISEDPGDDPGGNESGAPKTVTITGLPFYNGLEIMVALYATKPTPDSKEEDPPYGRGTIKNGSATVPLYNYSDDSPWTGTGNWYVGFFTESDAFNLVYVTKTARSFSNSAANATMALTDFDEMDPNEAPNRPDGPGNSDEPTRGTLTVTGFSGVFIEAYVVAETITSGNFAAVMEAYEEHLAVGKGGPDDYPAELYWHFGEGSGTYNVLVLIRSNAGDFIKFQNGVTFVNGSGSVNWGSMTAIDMTQW
jgi:hypothetical protein